MGYYDLVKKYESEFLKNKLNAASNKSVESILNKENLNEWDFLTLISEPASNYLEKMAIRAKNSTVKHFGKSIVLYAPIYLANYCINQCLYCGFNVRNRIERKKLSMEDFEKECIRLIVKT